MRNSNPDKVICMEILPLRSWKTGASMMIIFLVLWQTGAKRYVSHPGIRN